MNRAGLRFVGDLQQGRVRGLSVSAVATIAGVLVLSGCQSLGPSSHSASIAESNETSQTSSNKPADAVRLADAMRRAGQYEAAIKSYRKAVDEGGDSYDVRMGLGASISGIGDLTGAAVEFRTAQTMQPSRAEPGLSLGRIDLLQHKPAEALLEFDAALKLSPGEIAGWNGKGYALDMLERHQEAQEAYRTGLAGAPDDHTLQNNYGLSLALSGDYAAAIKELTALVQEPGATARNRQNLALALGLQGNKEDARFISEADLDKSAIENNLRYYDAVRSAPIRTQSAEIPPAATIAPPPSTPVTSGNTDASVPAATPASSLQPANAVSETALPAPLPLGQTAPADPVPAAPTTASPPAPESAAAPTRN